MEDREDNFGEMEQKRDEATAKILASVSRKKLIIAGPGTGKTHIFQELLQASGQKGLALTFIRNLVTDLSNALDDLADVFTFHGFCKHQLHRHAVEGLSEGWDYYPPLLELIEVDLGLLETPATKRTIEAGLHNLDDSDGVVSATLLLGNYYNAVSHTDLVYRVLRHFQSNDDKIPTYPLIVVDEYQDFSLLETSFISLLASKSPVVIAGDDDQALYSFKNASARYIRELAEDPEYERLELPYCSRCTHIIVEAVNTTVRKAVTNGNLPERLEKPFECYLPDKREDSDAHPTIIHARCSVERNNAKYVGRYVTQQIEAIGSDEISESVEGGYPTVLVIGPNPFLERAHGVINDRYPHAQLKTAAKSLIAPLDAYRRLAKDQNSRLGWRILLHTDPFTGWEDVLKRVLENEEELALALPTEYRELHLAVVDLIRSLLDEQALDETQETKLCEAVGMTMAEIKDALAIAADSDEGEEGEEGAEADPSVRPDHEPSIVCTSLVGAKGLSASHVFVVGFNEEHFPRDGSNITDEEVCCFLVALSRTRKQCHLVSCGHFGRAALRPSAFARWVAPHVEERTIDAAYFRS
jgi:ATP-dependent DNA helicase UvrD/PcrA